MDRRVPRGLQAAVLRCLEKDRNARFPSIAALAAALAPFARDQRAAAMIVDRTSLMVRRAIAVVELPGGPVQSSSDTTMRASNGQTQPRTKRRSYSFISVTSLLLSVGAFTALFLLGSADAPGTSQASNVEGRDIASAPDAAPTIAALPVASPDVVREQRAKADECAKHKSESQWQALGRCAESLELLGAKDEARAFHKTARREISNEFAADRVHGALRAGNLKDAQQLLATIDSDSVYFASFRDEFDKAEAAQSEQAERKAQGYARSQDCASLQRYVAELAATSTKRVAAAARSVPCQDGRPPLRRASTAGQPPATTGSPPAASNTQPTIAAPTCEGVDADGLMDQAASKYVSGDAKAALALALTALACNPQTRTYRFVVTYACAAHEVGPARLYFPKIPAAYQTNLEQKCQQEGLNVRGP
jgi:hypothetical protein